jgi:hypothetical protein
MNGDFSSVWKEDYGLLFAYRHTPKTVFGIYDPNTRQLKRFIAASEFLHHSFFASYKAQKFSQLSTLNHLKAVIQVYD